MASYDQEYAHRLGEEPLPGDKFSAIEAERNALLVRFGNAFGKDFGWAAHLFKNKAFKDKAPEFWEIEKKVGLDHWRPYYKMSSDTIHPNAHGLYYRLGLGEYSGSTLLAGPSNYGLANPGHSTAISLHQITTVLLEHKPTDKGIFVSEILATLEHEVGEAFLKVHQKVAATPPRLQ